MKNRSLLIKALPIIAATGIIGAILMAFFLVGCGSTYKEEPLLSGIFVDDVVEGLEFRAGDRVGYTDSEGKFYYRKTETVGFYVGGVKIGETSEAKPMTTPIDLVDEPNSFVLHPTVTNICRFLQTLDDDGNPDNGIRITKQTRDAIQASGIQIQFNLSDTDFSNQPRMSDLLDAVGVAELKSKINANKHFFKSLAKRLVTPAIMINLGDSLTTGAQSGFGNAYFGTQNNGFTADIASQLFSLSDYFFWENPLLNIKTEEYDLAHNFNRRYFRFIDGDTEAQVATEQYLVPYNLGVPGATTASLINENTSGTEFNPLDELLRPIPELVGDNPASDEVERQELSQLDAALYVAKLDENKNMLKIFTLWIGMEDILGKVFKNLGSELTVANIPTTAECDAVKNNITDIVNQLSKPEEKGIEYGQVFIATLPHVESLGMLFGKNDIERMAQFDDANITALGANEFIGYKPFIGDFAHPDPDTSISMALNVDNDTLNNRIAQVKSEDGNWLSENEKNLINDRIDAINNHIKFLANADPDDNIYLVDVDAEIYQKLDDVDSEGNFGLNISTFRPNDDNIIDEGFAEEWNMDLFLDKTMGGGFFSHDGYHPGHTGYACISFLFMNKIQDAGIGFDLEATFVNEFDGKTYPAYDAEITDFLLIDPYGIDQDGDHFVSTPGYALFDGSGGENDVHGYDAVHTGGWIDCNDTDETILPFYIGGDQLADGDEENIGPCYYIVPDYTE
ncbi:MAG: hypothetical protein KKF30_02275 [Proteobacteria bacterium]|nr:hypothetical protein [Pseudomonadota bacterium]MBU4471573.1 hypothetical protein [Pseudomonadota bacterium]MCG2752579.1 hypothetical protein [Desulfobacteraceae bacterium]